MTPQSESTTRVHWYWAARLTAGVALIFVVTVSALMLVDYGRRQWDNPFESPRFVTLKQQFAATPQDTKLQEQLRVLDHELRREFFRQQRFAIFGAHLLLLGAIVLAAAWKLGAVLRRTLPSPAPVESSQAAKRRMAAARAARWSAVVVIGVVTAAGAWAAGASGTVLPMTMEQVAALGATPEGQPGDDQKPDEPAGPAWPTDKEIAKMWPQFRGPAASGISAYTNIPTTWDVASGKNLVWKTPVPLPGNNSPVVWGDRVFISGADTKRREVYCFDAASGKLLWTREAPSTARSRAKAPRVEDVTGYAAPTMTTDGRRAWAIFANGDLVAVDYEGNVLWSKSLGIPKENMYGYSASLVTYQGRLFIQWDEGSADDKLSKMIALDGATGKPVWQTPRPVTGSWSSPVVFQHGGRAQLVTASDPLVISYDPATGKELWRAEGLFGDQGVTPVLIDGLIQVGNEYSEWLAIRPGGTGNVTESHIVWRGEDGLPDTVSPLVADGLLLLTTSGGILTCYDAAEGEMLWEKDLDAEITSSPTLVGSNVYVFAKSGHGFIIKPSREDGEIVSETELGEQCVTSPAMQDGRMYIRTEKHLICIGQTKQDN